MTDETNNEAPALTQEHIEILHSLLVGNEIQLANIGEHHSEIFGNALIALATFAVEKVYACSPNMEEAGKILAMAQENGLANWADAQEHMRTQADAPRIITPN